MIQYHKLHIIALTWVGLCIFVMAQVAGAQEQSLTDLSRLLAGVQPGITVTLPAGHYRGGVTVPPGVSLRGAGYRQTIIDATGCDTGLTVTGGKGATIAGVTVTGARVTGIAVKHAEAVCVSGVRTTGSMVGLNVDTAVQPRVENVISDHNRFGIVMNNCQKGVVVNCTVVDCEETGLQFPTGEGMVAFNNVVANVSTSVNIGASQGITLDHNLYMANFVGQMDAQIPRSLLIGWQSLSGLDAHSVQMPVTFRDAASGDYTPTSTLLWALDRITTAGWGSVKLAGVTAPKVDAIGGKRQGTPALGALTATAATPRPADGQFQVSRGDGLTSAGVFTRDGVLLAYLFHNLPLGKGTYRYWLPSRNYAGQPVAAGNYEVRLVESKLRWQYLNHIGDNGDDAPVMSGSASFNPTCAVFLPGGVLMGEGPSEDHTNLRSYTLAERKLSWTMSGGSPMRGVALGSDGRAYTLRELNADTAWLTRLDPSTGKIISWGREGLEHLRIKMGKGAGLAELGGKLYTVADGKLVMLDPAALMRDPEHPAIAGTLPVASPSKPTADATTQCLWVISMGKLVALAPDGTVRATVTPVADPVAIGAAGGKLAVASSATGKIHIFDAHDPANLQPLRTVGTGDSPFGPFAPDRFLFKRVPEGRSYEEDETVDVALSAQGELAVADFTRFIYFDAQGHAKWYTFGIFGNRTEPSYSTGHRRMWEPMFRWSFLLDDATGQWAPEALWDFYAIPHDRWNPWFNGDFSVGGKTYGVFCGVGNTKTHLAVARLEKYHAVPVYMIVPDPTHPGQLIARKDSNHDGVIDAKDGGETVLGPDGKPLPYLFTRFQYLQENGDLLISIGSQAIYRWPCTIDADGVPIYRPQDRKLIISIDEKTFINPYDGKPGIGNGIGTQASVVTAQPSGGYTLQVDVRGSGGTGLNNGAGSDLLGVDAKGNPRWMHLLSSLHGIAGLGTANGVTITTAYYSGQYLAFDEDGLGLGGFTETPRLHYSGYWIDHPNLAMYRGQDGHAYVTFGDNADGRYPWYRQLGDDQIIRKRVSCTVSAKLAATLAELPKASAVAEVKPPQAHVTIPRLSAPFPIDSDLAKWRKAGIQPQIMLPPGAGGAANGSAVIRLGYEGQNLYVQVLEFDDVPTFNFGAFLPVLQDCVEMAINGASVEGFQFLAFRGPDGKTGMWRNRFFANLGKTLDPAHSPCSVIVLPDATQVTERASLEALWGADLSKSKVIITEFKLPLDAQTYSGAEEVIPKLGPGKSFWLGFFVDDGDIAGDETQHPMVWPPKFGFFNPKEDGALAVCE